MMGSEEWLERLVPSDIFHLKTLLLLSVCIHWGSYLMQSLNGKEFIFCVLILVIYLQFRLCCCNMIFFRFVFVPDAST